MAAADLSDTFAALRGVLKKHAARVLVTADTATNYTVASREKKDRAGRPLFIAGVIVRKNYVSYHFIPIYGLPALAKTLSPELRKRMQGKGCFNFKTIEPNQLRELAALTKTGIAKLERTRLPWEQASRK